MNVVTENRLAYTPDELATASGVSRAAIYVAISDGRIPARRFGKRILVPAEDARTWLTSLPTAFA